MARTRTAKHPKPVEPEEESQEIPDEEPATTPVPQGGFETHGRTGSDPTPVSKADAVRAALKEGLDAPGDIAEFIKAKYGIELPKQMISSYKAQQKARDAKKEAPKPKPGRKPRTPAVENYVAPPPKKAGDGEVDLLAAMEAMKPLVASLGADKVKRIVDLLG
jgi:hypothetical protein